MSVYIFNNDTKHASLKKSNVCKIKWMLLKVFYSKQGGMKRKLFLLQLVGNVETVFYVDIRYTAQFVSFYCNLTWVFNGQWTGLS